jgi:hypothetical protein
MSKNQCNAKNKSGEPCQASANGNGFCFTHDVSKGAERAIARRNGGLKRITPSVADKSLVPKETRTITNVMVTTPNIARQLLRTAIEKYLGVDAVTRFQEKRQVIQDLYQSELEQLGIVEIDDLVMAIHQLEAES